MFDSREDKTWGKYSKDWHELVEEDPDFEGHTFALDALMRGTTDDPWADNASDTGAEMSPRWVDPSDVTHVRHPRSDPRVASAARGYTKNPLDVPPIILVQRGGTHEVVDGHHRLSAAKYQGLDRVRAWVADSPLQDPWGYPDES